MDLHFSQPTFSNNCIDAIVIYQHWKFTENVHVYVKAFCFAFVKGYANFIVFIMVVHASLNTFISQKVSCDEPT